MQYEGLSIKSEIRGGSIIKTDNTSLQIVKQESLKKLTSIFKTNLDIKYAKVSEKVAALG